MTVEFRRYGNDDMHQCGGYSCLHFPIGKLIQSFSDEIEDALYTIFYYSTKYRGWCDDGIDDADADAVENLVPGFKVDRNMLSNCVEAYIHGTYKNIDGILIWENSD